MSEINNIKKQAQEIAGYLDRLDGKNNKIDAETWKKYAVSNWGAKDNVSNNISIFNAVKSIEFYLKREAKATGNKASDIGEKWYNDLVSIENKNSQPKATKSTESEEISEQTDALYIDNTNNKIASKTKENRDLTAKLNINPIKQEIVSKMHQKWSSKYKNSNLNQEFYSKLYDFIKQINCEVDDKDFDRKHYSSKEEQTMDEVIAVIAGESSLNSKAKYYTYRGIFQLDSDSLNTVKFVAKDKKLPGVNQNITLSGFAKLSGEKQLDYLAAHIAYGRMSSGLSEKEKISPQQLWAMIKKPKHGQKHSDLTQQKSIAINRIFNKNKIERGIT